MTKKDTSGCRARTPGRASAGCDPSRDVVIALPSSWPERQVVDVPGTFRGSVGSGHQPEAGDHPIVSRHDPGHAAPGHRPPVFTAAQQPLTSVGMAQAPRVTDTFSCTGGEQSWTVPAGVDQATFVVEGAAGGGLGDVPPGLGGRAEATVAVTAGTVYTIVVGRQGQRPGGYWPGVKPAQGGFGFGRGGGGGPARPPPPLGAGARGGGGRRPRRSPGQRRRRWRVRRPARYRGHARRRWWRRHGLRRRSRRGRRDDRWCGRPDHGHRRRWRWRHGHRARCRRTGPRRYARRRRHGPRRRQRVRGRRSRQRRGGGGGGGGGWGGGGGGPGRWGGGPGGGGGGPGAPG